MIAGLVDGKHYSEFVEEVKDFKRKGEFVKAEALLLRLIQAVEEEAKVEHWCIASWYYEQLAIIYRKQKAYSSELSILNRFARHNSDKTHPLLERLKKAKAHVTEFKGGKVLS
jgi:hypothetical protein